ncbi:MAG: ABC transporter ATP-binding protein [Gemmatimonadetes bacterium]|nr:ABC transporter ATP-binding protein [Gemmatimonadota bacterium]
MHRHVELRLLDVARPYRGLFGLGLLATFFASLLDSATIVILIPLLEALFGTAGTLSVSNTTLEAVTNAILAPLIGGIGPREAGARLVVLLAVLLVIKNALTYASNQVSVAVQESLVRDLRTRLFRHLLRLDLGFFQRTKQGELISGLLADVDQSKQVVSAALAAFFQNLVLIAGSLTVLGLTSWRLTLITLAAAPVMVWGIRELLQRLRHHASAWADERGLLTSTVTERLGAIKLIRAYGAEDTESDRFAAQTARYRKRVIRTQRYSSLTSPVSEVFGGLVIILIIVAASNPSISGVTLGPAVTIGFLAVALKMMAPIKSLSQFPTNLAVALASAERVFRWLDLPAADQDESGLAVARFQRQIEFRGVGFSYGQEPVLAEVSFTIPRGSIVAVVGPSGAGKTTLLELVPRFHDPARGSILIDGVATTALARSSLRALIGLVGQDTVVLNDTVHANIAYGRPEATREQVIAAARAANALEFIERLPDGFDTSLGERGTRLSGGQRQRIAIARALLRDPPILILDEATSALDTESERLVQEAIDRLMADRTVLVVAHRLATVQHADDILVLDQGRIVERGDHTALLAANGLYRRLYEMQFRTVPEDA